MAEVAVNCTNATLDVDEEGTFRLRWTPGTTVSVADAAAVIAAVRGATVSCLQPMMVEVVDVTLTAEARKLLLGTRFVRAVALIGATVVDRVVAAALLRGEVSPHGYFTSEDAAREWLGQLRVSDALEAV